MRELFEGDDFQTTYSSHIEDYLIRHILPYNTGVYIDIGAYHPIKESNTFALYQRGWTGLLVEPQPLYADLLRKERVRDIIVEKAVSDFNGKAEMKLWWGASSLIESWPIPDKDLQGNPTGKINVNVVEINDLLNEYSSLRDNCDLCNIDVEGGEGSIIRAINFTKFRPKLFVVEAIEWKTMQLMHRSWDQIILDAGYRYVTDNIVNRFYVDEGCSDVCQRALAFGKY